MASKNTMFTQNSTKRPMIGWLRGSFREGCREVCTCDAALIKLWAGESNDEERTEGRFDSIRFDSIQRSGLSDGRAS
jgi:hypothetical protein